CGTNLRRNQLGDRTDERRQVDDVERCRSVALDCCREVIVEKPFDETDFAPQPSSHRRGARHRIDDGVHHRALFSCTAPSSPDDAKRSSGKVSLLNLTTTLPESLALTSSWAVLSVCSCE